MSTEQIEDVGTAIEPAREIARRMRNDAGHCNCDLDNWEPEQSTGHSHVCRIHVAAIAEHDSMLRARKVRP